MIENNLTRREALMGMAAASIFTGRAKAESSGSSIHWMSAIELARLIRTKKLSAREVLAEHLKQIERVNPKVNAIVTLVPEMAQKAAAAADEKQARGDKLGPLHGLPVAHKDLRETRGIRTTFGSPLYRDYIPTENDLIVDRLQAAGAITVGKTNTPEFGEGSQTFNTVFGATKNPWDLTKTCGGSSGGAAVALACGLVPVADGSDTGGSLRNPAVLQCGRVPPDRRTCAGSEGSAGMVDAEYVGVPRAVDPGSGIRSQYDCGTRFPVASFDFRTRSPFCAPTGSQLQRCSHRM